MARSTYIYVVMLESDLIGAFTVKHELVTVLKRMAEYWPSPVEAYRVYRLGDGGAVWPEPGHYMGTGRQVCDGAA